MTVREPMRHNRAAVGDAVHRTCARLLASGVLTPTPGAVLSVASEEPALNQPHVYGLAARQRLLTSVMTYFYLLPPDAKRWRYVTYPTPAALFPDALLFENADRRLQLDVLVASGRRRPSTDAWATKLLAGACVAYGPQFHCLRVVLIQAPDETYSLFAQDRGPGRAE